jgi:hypothetical protein
MTPRGWIDDKLAKLFISSRESWGLTLNRHSKFVFRDAEILDWEFTYNRCRHIPSKGEENYFIHPGILHLRPKHKYSPYRTLEVGLSLFFRLELNSTHSKANLESLLKNKLGPTSNPIIVEEIAFPIRIDDKNSIIHPTSPLHYIPRFYDGRTWPNFNNPEIPFIYDATHYVKGIMLSRKKTGTEVVYDDIRYHQHGCRRGAFFPERIDEHFNEGIGGQQGKIQDFIDTINETIDERKFNSRILVFEKDSKLRFDAWTSDSNFRSKWNDFLKYLRFSVVEFEHALFDGVLGGESRSEYIPYGPLEAHFCCYMFTPVEQANP